MLKKAGITGNIGPIVELFSWRNGLFPMQDVTGDKTRLFPNSRVSLLKLDDSIDHCSSFKELVEFKPTYKTLCGRYFPLFWDGSCTYLIVDLQSMDGRILVLETQSKHFLREGYSSFAAFLRDAIDSNRNGEPLLCFREHSKVIPVVCDDSIVNDGSSRSKNVMVLRTFFSDEAAWESLCRVLRDAGDFGLDLDYVSDQAYTGLAAEKFPVVASGKYPHSYAYIADRIALESPEHPVLVVDLRDNPRRTFRVAAFAFAAVESNLSIANMGFEEFANAVDQDGIFRGFGS